MVTVKTRLISLLGRPLTQTLAPQMFNETFAELGMDYFYFPIETEGEALGTIISAIRCMNYAGFNVTKPNKAEVLPLLDELDQLAETIGSVNVVTIRDGVLKGYNTDGTGFVQALREESGLDLADSSFLVLGAGGASRAVCSTLAFEGAKEIHIIDMIDESSRSLAGRINDRIRDCARFHPSADAPLADLIAGVDVLVNATGVGMYPNLEATPVDRTLLHPDLFVIDITYNPTRTRLLRDAEKVGCRTMNGVGMVINQGIRGFALMTGEPEPVEIMNRVMRRLMKELSEKGR